MVCIDRDEAEVILKPFPWVWILALWVLKSQIHHYIDYKVMCVCGPTRQEVSFITICLPIVPSLFHCSNWHQVVFKHELPKVVDSKKESNEHEILLDVKKDVAVFHVEISLLVLF
jgi:hypothetical protein